VATGDAEGGGKGYSSENATMCIPVYNGEIKRSIQILKV
jgi:hypothetical protein